MRTFVCALCILWGTPILCTFYGSCPKKEPPPGVVIVSQGSELVMTCSGHVTIDGVKVTSNANGLPAAVTRSTVNSVSHNAVLPKQQISKSRESEGRIVPTSSSSSVSQPIRTKSEWDPGRVGEFEDEFDDEGKDERATKFNLQWKFTKDGQGIAEGPTLSLSHVKMSDSGRYSCHQRGTERFSTRVIVTEAPETPHLSCYKKSPSSKIRCEWSPQRPVYKGTSCSLFIRKRLEGGLMRVPCSYSTRRSRCWCALDHNEDDNRVLHQAFLCVSSFVSNVTSELFSFKPMHILKPDPPYNVSVQPLAGLSQSLMITWKPPYTWKFHDQFYELIYEIRYKPSMSINYQTVAIDGHITRHTITDADTGKKYEVQIRAKDEYEGQWSEWSAPQYGHSWTTVLDVSNEDTSTTSWSYLDSEGSGTEEPSEDFSLSRGSPEVASHHYVWMMIAVVMGVSLIILVVYMIRYKDRCMSKLQTMGVLAQCSDTVHPRPAPADIAPAVAERHALLNKDRPPNEVKERSEQELKAGERIEATIFSNTSYFLVPREI